MPAALNRPAPSADPARMERFMLLSDQWRRGYRTVSALFGPTGHRTDIISLPIDGATAQQRAAALAVMKKYGIKAEIARSVSLGNIDVIRVAEDIVSLGIARDMAQPASWRENTVYAKKGEPMPALNLSLSTTTRDTLSRAVAMLKDMGIPAEWVRSRSLGDVCVVRVAGEGDIARLKATIHGLSDGPRRQAAPPQVPAYPADTHVHAVGADGIIVVRRRCKDGNGKVENPDGPAVVSPDGERFALDGRFMPEAEWRADASRTVHAARNARP